MRQRRGFAKPRENDVTIAMGLNEKINGGRTLYNNDSIHRRGRGHFGQASDRRRAYDR
jgi:hypothetical protein